MEKLIRQFALNELEKTRNDIHYKKLVMQSMRSETIVPFQVFSRGGIDDIAILTHTMEANYCPGIFHTHDFFELIYMHEGTATQHFPDRDIELAQHSICLLNTNVCHGISIPDSSCILLNIMISRQLFQKSFFNLIADNDLFNSFFIDSMVGTNTKQQYYLFPGAKDSEVERLLHTLIVEYIQKKPCYQASMQCCLSLIFTELLRSHIDQLEAPEENNVRFSSILSYINDHVDTITLNDLALHFHYNSSYLSKLFKKYTTKSFSEIVSELRLQKACSYLTNTTASIDAIADMLGYYDRSYFNRVFRKNFQMSPNAYRKASRLLF